MLRPSAAVRLTPAPVSVATTPVAADCALIAATALARLLGQRGGAVDAGDRDRDAVDV